MSLGILFALSSALSYAFNNIINKKLSEKLNEYESLVISSFFLIVFGGLFNYIWGSFKIHLNYEIIIFMFLGSFIGFIGLLHLFKSFSQLPIGIILTIMNTFPLVTLLLTIIYNRIGFELLYLLPFFIIFFGIYYLHSSSEKSSKKYLYMPLITALSFGFYSFASFNLLQNNLSPITITFYMESLVFLFAIIFALSKNKLRFSKKKIQTNLKMAIFAGLTLTFGNLFLNLALSKIHPAIASSIGTSDILFGSILSYLIFKEKLTKKEIIGMSIISLGILLYFFI